MKRVLDSSSVVHADTDSLSIGSNQKFKEIINFSITDTNPSFGFQFFQDYSYHKFSLAVGRFLWMMRGSNSLLEILPYDEMAKFFSDDDKSIIGSSYGHRIFNSHFGNQFNKVFQILNKTPNSKRAIINLYDTSDLFRISTDIPCVLNISFHIRDQKLIQSVNMRGSNAYRLFPYNYNEFVSLGSLLSKRLNIPLGKFNFNATSIHIYERDFVAADQLLKEIEKNKFLDVCYKEYFQIFDNIDLLQESELNLRTNKSIDDLHKTLNRQSKILIDAILPVFK